MSSQNYEANGYTHDMDLLVISHLNDVFHTLLEAGAERE